MEVLTGWRWVSGGNASAAARQDGVYIAMGIQNNPSQLPRGRGRHTVVLHEPTQMLFVYSGPKDNQGLNMNSDTWRYNINTDIWDWFAIDIFVIIGNNIL